MSNRITITTLRTVCAHLNRVDAPSVYHISQAYGGYALHKEHNAQGGIRDVFSSGHTTAKDLYNRMQAFISGLNNK